MDFKGIFGFVFSGFGPIEEDIVKAKLMGIAFPYHDASNETQKIRAKYDTDDHGLDWATMLADHARLTELKTIMDESSKSFWDALVIAKEAGVKVVENIDQYKAPALKVTS